LGALQGPAELLPVSSSGHLALAPALFGWHYAELPGDVRKTVEVALHAGSAPALAFALRGELRGDAGGLALTVAPPALAGLIFERPVEERLGGLVAIGVAQVAAGAALILADRRPQRRQVASGADHLAVGLAQAVALVPGVSRLGAALTAARLRGLSRGTSASLALRAALPVTVGATGLKGARALSGGLPPGLRAPLAAGAGASLVSALVALRVAPRERWTAFGAYRMALGGLILAREVRKRRKVSRPPL
jgi:undecaprenyl-diphosphatase